MIVGGVNIRWSPKLRPEKLQRLYETDARGIVDEELIDEVGYTLYSRCDSILTVTEAFAGRLKCPGCGFVSERETGTGGAAERLHCPECGWEASWHEYHKSWQHRQLWGGNAVPVFQEFVRRFPDGHHSPAEDAADSTSSSTATTTTCAGTATTGRRQRT